MKLLSRFLHSIGVTVIILISVLSILLGIVVREMSPDHPYKKYLQVFSNLEHKFYDYRSNSHLHKNKKDQTSVLVAIDDESLQKINSWPIPRENYAILINNLKKYGAKVIAFDVMFPEPVKACSDISPDDIFSNSINEFQSEENKRVIMAYTIQKYQKGNPDFFQETPPELYSQMVDNRLDNENITFTAQAIERHTYPIQKLLDTESDMAYLNMEEDADGVFRHYQLVANVDNLFFPSLGFKAYLNYSETNPQIKVDQFALGTMEINGKTLFINPKGETKVKWLGDADKFDVIPLYRVLEGKDYDVTETVIKGDLVQNVKKRIELEKVFKDKIVFIGSTATGAHDLRNTSINSKLPGVFVHMNLVNMLHTQNFFKPLNDSIIHTLYILVAGLIILITTMFFGKAILDLIILISISFLAYYLDYNYYILEGYELRLAAVYFAFISTYSWVTFLNFNQASVEKKQIKGAFSRYVAPAIVNDMLENPDKLKVGGEKRDITCLFSDVRDFTSISEKLTATELALALNRYMGAMTDVVFETNGTLDKYIGDAIVAFWGAPIDIGDHVNQAMEAAVKMLEILPNINHEFEKKGLPEFKIGLGLNSGECSVGNMGSDQIFAYTALGDNMNLGARLESLCKHYGAQILISEFTYDRMDKNRFQSRLIDKVKVKGKTQPVGVYEVLYSYHPFQVDQDSLNNFKEAYDLYIKGKFEESIKLFTKIKQYHPHDKATNRLLETCQYWLKNPPKDGEDWTITTMTTK